MSGLPIVILAAASLLGVQPLGGGPAPAPQPPPKKSDPQPPPPAVVVIEIVVGAYVDLSAMCGQGASPTTVFVTNDKSKVTSKPEIAVHHCIGKKLHDHAGHEKDPKAFDPADVKLVAGQRVRWISKKASFRVVDITKPKNPTHEPQDKEAPLRPFGEFSKAYALQVESPPVPQINGEVVVRQRYKVTFEIENVGLVDPDLICSM